MLHFIDELLRQQLVRSIPGLNANDVRFQPPDADWRAQVGLGDRVMLNVYLVDLRENRVLRSNAVEERFAEGQGFGRPAPLRVDCHYLISAEAPGAPGQAVEPTLDEHALLSEAITAFDRAVPLTFARVFDGIPLPPGLPAALVDEAMPFELLPAPGWPKLEEFWSSMGDGAVHKPAVYLVVTAPFVRPEQLEGGIVTTLDVGYLPGEVAGGETLYSIGGRVGNSAAPEPDGTPGAVEAAWVELLTSTGRRLAMVRSDPDGAYIFERLTSDNYRLRVSAENLGSQIVEIVIPTTSGSYDFVF